MENAAVDLATKAVELNPKLALATCGTLSTAYAECGDFAKAIEYQKKALQDRNYERQFGADARTASSSTSNGSPIGNRID